MEYCLKYYYVGYLKGATTLIHNKNNKFGIGMMQFQTKGTWKQRQIKLNIIYLEATNPK